LAKNGFAKQPEEDPQVERIGVVYDVDHKNRPGKGSDDRVDDGEEDEPREPVGQVGHAHDSHGLFSTGLFFAGDLEDCIVHLWDKRQQQEQGQKQSKIAGKWVVYAGLGLHWLEHQRDERFIILSLLCKDLLRKKVLIKAEPVMLVVQVTENIRLRRLREPYRILLIGNTLSVANFRHSNLVVRQVDTDSVIVWCRILNLHCDADTISFYAVVLCRNVIVEILYCGKVIRLVLGHHECT